MNSEINKDSEIIALAQLTKALLQRKSKLVYDINNIRIKQSYVKLNHNWRAVVDLVKKLLIVKKIYSLTKRQLAATKDKAHDHIAHDHILSGILIGYKNILEIFDVFSNDLQNYERNKQEFKNLQSTFESKTNLLTLLQLKHNQHQQDILCLQSQQTIINFNKIQIQTLKSQISDLNEKIKAKSLISLSLSTNNFTHSKTANILSSLSPKQLLLRSKLLLKQDLTKIYENALKEHEKYSHFLTLEKRKLQKLTTKDEKTMTKIKLNFSNNAESCDSYLNGLSLDTDSSLNLNSNKLTHARNFSAANGLKIDLFDEVVDTQEMVSLNESVRNKSQKLRGRLESLSRNLKFLF